MIKHEGERCAHPCVRSQYGGGVYVLYESTLSVNSSSISINYAGEVTPPVSLSLFHSYTLFFCMISCY